MPASFENSGKYRNKLTLYIAFVQWRMKTIDRVCLRNRALVEICSSTTNTNQMVVSTHCTDL